MSRLLYIILLQILIIPAQYGESTRVPVSKYSRSRRAAINRRYSRTDTSNDQSCAKCDYKIPDQAIKDLSDYLADIIRDFVQENCNNKNCGKIELEEVLTNPNKNIDGSRRFGSSEEDTTTEVPTTTPTSTTPTTTTTPTTSITPKSIPLTETTSNICITNFKTPPLLRKVNINTTPENEPKPDKPNINVQVHVESIESEESAGMQNTEKYGAPPPTTTVTEQTTDNSLDSVKSTEESSESGSSEEINVFESTTNTPQPITSTESIDRQTVEELWTTEYNSNPNKPKIEDVHNKYKQGIEYLKDHPNATAEELEYLLMKTPQDKINFKDIIPILQGIGQNEDRLNEEYDKIVNSDDDNLKYKTAIAFLKVRGKGNKDEINLQIEEIKKRAKSLKDEEKELMNKLSSLSDEYSKLQAAYGLKIKESEDADKDKVVVAVLKFPFKKDNESYTDEQMNKVIDKVKEKYTKDYEMVAPETIKLVKDVYIFTEQEKSEILIDANNAIDILKKGADGAILTLVESYNVFMEVYSKLPEQFLDQDDEMFRLNPYQDSNQVYIQLDPTQSLKTLQNNIRHMIIKKKRRTLSTSDHKIYEYLIKILYLIIDRVESSSSRPHVSVYSTGQKEKP